MNQDTPIKKPDPGAQPGGDAGQGPRLGRLHLGGALEQNKPAPKPAPVSDTPGQDGKVVTPAPGDGQGPNVVAVRARPVAGPARPRRRHLLLSLSFMVFVLLPILFGGLYLWIKAADQYASTTGFTVSTAETTAALDLLGGLSGLTGSSASTDADVLYEFIQSQDLVRRIDIDLDLRAIYSKAWPSDPIFAYDPTGSIEDLVDYWSRMVRISYDASTGLIELRVLAFDPDDAQRIGQAIYAESTKMINELSAIAREDATRYAREELDLAVERLKVAREAFTAFRSRTQIVDPKADLQVQMGLLNTLNQQLAEALINSDLLVETTLPNDPRITQTQRRIDVIQKRIVEERRKFAVGGQGPGGADYATVVAEFERLTVDLEFAQQSYIAALSAFDVAKAEAQRQSRYLAAYVRPTLAETPEYPERGLLFGLGSMFLILAWSILALVYYSVRDRR